MGKFGGVVVVGLAIIAEPILGALSVGEQYRACAFYQAGCPHNSDVPAHGGRSDPARGGYDSVVVSTSTST